VAKISYKAIGVITIVILGYSNYYPHPSVEEPWNFQGRGCINLGISCRGALTLEFPGERVH
jgi:hypothetical protein